MEPVISAVEPLDIARSLCELLIDSKAYNPASKFVNFDFIWRDAETNKTAARLISRFIQENIPADEISGLIGLDSIVYPFGILPTLPLISAYLDKPLGIIKEDDDPITGDHKIYGEIPDRNGLFLYDVTRMGLTAYRMLGFLHRQGKFPRWFVTFVDSEQDAEKALMDPYRDRPEYRFTFLRITTINQIAAISDGRK
jgi:hypothetical protein